MPAVSPCCWRRPTSCRSWSLPTTSIRAVADPAPHHIALDPDNRYGISSAQTDAFLATQPNSLAARNFNPIPPTQHLDNQFWGVSATIEWLTDLGTFTLLPAYRETDLDTVGTGIGVTATTVEHDRQTSIEARLASDLSRRFNYIVGAYYFDEINDIPLFVPNTQYTMTVQKYDTGVESAAAFGQLRYELTESMRATLGARYTHEDKFFEGSFESSVRFCPPKSRRSCPDAARIPATQVTPVVTVPEGEFEPYPSPRNRPTARSSAASASWAMRPCPSRTGPGARPSIGTSPGRTFCM